MKRRTFIKRSTAATIPLALGGLKVSALNNSLIESLNVEDDRVLVIIQLNGGNDGLNMLIPKDQFANLTAVRPNIIIPENTVLDLTDTAGFHPVMGDLKNVFDDGKLGLIQSVGYPNQNRSHFRSTDIWDTASSAEEVLNTGWVGRYFNTFAPDYPTGYPNDEFPDPFAVTIGSSVSETCEGFSGNYSMALVDPNNLTALSTPVNGSLPDSCFGDKMDFLVTSIIQTNAYNEVIETAYANGNNLSDKYNNNLAEKLKLVARLISGGLQTKVYVVSLGGFDTHANQVQGDTTTGEHAALLEELSTAICAFQDDLGLLGLEQKVLGMTYSEFGRRIRSNDSLGTDHGTAAPMIVFGECVMSGILGENPEISTDVSQNEGVPMQFDFRSVYGTILMDWFGLEQSVVQDLLFEDFQHLPILHSPCTTTNTNNILKEENIKLDAFPNPFNTSITVEFKVLGGWAKVSLFDTIGNELKILTNQRFNEGKHTLNMEGNGLVSGVYYLHIQTEYGNKVKRLVKV